MREILFRGKCYDDGGWISGSLLDDDIIVTKGAVEVDEDYIQIVDEWSSLIPETVGQYTERKDKTGIRIFEGDIVKIGSFIYQVEFRYSEWEFRILSKKVYCFPNFDSHTGECEIIGNIHDNPELLEVQP